MADSFMEPPAWDESYQGAPAEGFEDSKGSGVALFKSGVSLGGPTDFGFLLEGSDNADASAAGLGSRVAKRGRTGAAMVVDGQDAAPVAAMRPHEVLFGLVEGEDRGSQAMDPPVKRIDPFYWFRDNDHSDVEVQKLLREEDAYCTRAMERLRPLRERLYAEMIGHTKEADLDVPAPHIDGYAYYGRSFDGKAYRAHYRAKIVAGVGFMGATAEAVCGAEAARGDAAVPADVAASAALVGMDLRDEELLLDENELAADGFGGERAYLSVKGPALSGDGTMMSYATDVQGNDSYTVRIRPRRGAAAATGDARNFREFVECTDGSMEWDASGHAGFYYVKLDKEFRGCTVLRHVLSTGPSQDQVLLHEKDQRFTVAIGKTSDQRFLSVGVSSSETSEVHILDLLNPASGLQCVCARQFSHRYDVDHCLGSLILLTNKDGCKNSKLCRTPLESIPGGSCDSWQDLWVPGPHVTIDSFRCFERFLAVEGREHSVRRIFLLNWDAGDEGDAKAGRPCDRGVTVQAVEFPESQVHNGMLLTPRSKTAAISLFSVGFHDMNLFDSDTMQLWYASFAAPSRIYQYHVPTRTFKQLKDEPVPGFDPNLYRCERITSRDRGVPISLVYRSDLHVEGLRGGPYPTLLTGYGAYGACQDPDFDKTLLSLLDRGVLYAVAHVRGGGELGREWYEQGRYLHVKNRFHDFLAATETLVSLGVSESSRLVAWGESSGGLLVAGAANMRPDLFKAMLLEVPFVDALTTMADPSIPLTPGEWEEVGNPNEKETFYYMMEYSPYDNIRTTNYPAALLTSSLNDAMVGYWEPLKYAAKLRRTKTDSNPVLLKVNFNAGHGHSSDRYEYLQERAHNFAFVLDQLGI